MARTIVLPLESPWRTRCRLLGRALHRTCPRACKRPGPWRAGALGWAGSEILVRVPPVSDAVCVCHTLHARGRALALSVHNRYLAGVALVSAAGLQGRHDDPLAALRLFGEVISSTAPDPGIGRSS